MQNREAERAFLAWKAFHEQALPPEAVDSFYRFLGSWMMFNTIYNEPDQITGTPAGNGERHRVESFADNTALGGAHTNLLRQDVAYAASVDFVIQRNPPKPQWINVAPNPTPNAWNLDPSRAQDPRSHAYCQGTQDLSGLLGCLYVARCNLIHGDKRPGAAVDIELCQNAHVIVSNLLLNYVIK